MKKVILQIDDELYTFARQRAEEDEIYTVEGYLTGRLNMALFTEMADYEAWRNMPPSLPLVILMPEEHRAVDRRREKVRHDVMAELEEDEGGHMRHIDEEEADTDEPDDDLDDGIRF